MVLPRAMIPMSQVILSQNYRIPSLVAHLVNLKSPPSSQEPTDLLGPSPFLRSDPTSSFVGDRTLQLLKPLCSSTSLSPFKSESNQCFGTLSY